MRSLFSHNNNHNSSKQDSSVATNSVPTAATRTETISRQLNDTHDQKSLLEVDKLIKEIQQFLDGLNNAPKSNQSVFDKLRNLNRKSSTVIANHKVLSDKLSESEIRLNTISNNVLEHKKTLTNNASEFYYKLQTCIDYSHEVIPKRKSDLDFLSVLFSDIIAWIHYLQAMIRFHQEIIHQEQSAMYVPRMFDQQSTGRAFTSNINTTKEREDDLIMIHKLTRLKKVRMLNSHFNSIIFTILKCSTNFSCTKRSINTCRKCPSRWKSRPRIWLHSRQLN